MHPPRPPATPWPSPSTISIISTRRTSPPIRRPCTKSNWGAFMTALRDDVTADRRFELVPSSCAPNCPTDGPALGDRLRAASQAGTQILIIGIVHKLSTLVQGVRIAAIDTTAQRVVFRKYFQFRGDNDEAWQRAERFVSEEVRDRLLESRSQQ
ncbi:MAG TPA: DUF2380 domain-containing protein [Bradyrhizobium sp.]|nr:DUF2380 domain-containing protein [Bradyrhizobium sp.]